MNTKRVAPPVPPATVSGKRPLEDLEAVIVQCLSRIRQGPGDRRQVAIALLEIHNCRLYKSDYRTFESYLFQRWQITRPRGYQMLHFARLIQMSTAVDTAAPENERQARLFDSGGKARRPSEADPVVRAMDCVLKAFEELPPAERRGLVESVQDLLRDLEVKLGPKAKACSEGCS